MFAFVVKVEPEVQGLLRKTDDSLANSDGSELRLQRKKKKGAKVEKEREIVQRRFYRCCGEKGND